jgi:very-short-patch-repair endonuclease
MGVEQPGFGDILGLRPQVWSVSQVGDGFRDSGAMPARVCHVLQVRETGERGLAEVASAQRALVCLSQLRALGIRRGSYEHRVQVGALHRVFPTVLSVIHPLIEPWTAETAALLYAGDDVVISHDSAAALWGLTASPSFVAITLIDRHIKGQPGLQIHRVKTMDLRDLRHHQGFPVTSPARTLIDCGASPNIDDLLNEARVLKLVKDSDIYAAMDRCPRRKGVTVLRALLEAEKERGFTRSEAERILKRLVSDAGLEPPTFNTKVMGVEADAYWARLKLVVEVDGHRFHGHYRAFQRDRVKANRLVAAGFVVLRFTWPQLTQRPMQVVAEIARTLGRLEARAA